MRVVSKLVCRQFGDPLFHGRSLFKSSGMATIGDDGDGSPWQEHFTGDLNRSSRGVSCRRDLFIAAGQISQIEHHGFDAESGRLQHLEFAGMVAEPQIRGEPGFGQAVRRAVDRRLLDVNRDRATGGSHESRQHLCVVAVSCSGINHGVARLHDSADHVVCKLRQRFGTAGAAGCRLCVSTSPAECPALRADRR